MTGNKNYPIIIGKGFQKGIPAETALHKVTQMLRLGGTDTDE